jgi:WD40 repeat protein
MVPDMAQHSIKAATTLLVCFLASAQGLTPSDAQQLPPSKAATPTRMDRHGDPLPPGAVRRLGTVRYRFSYFQSIRQNLPDHKTALVSTETKVHWVNMVDGRWLESWTLPQVFTVCGFSPDGRRAFLSNYKDLQIWDLRQRRKVRTLRGKGNIRTDSVLFSPDGKMLVAMSGIGRGTGLLKVLDIVSGKVLWQQPVTTGFWWQGITPIGFLHDGRTLVLLQRDTMRVSLRDRATGQEMRSFATMPAKDARNCGLSPDDKTLFMGTAGTSVRAWDLASGKELPALSGHKNQAHSFAVSPDSKTVLTGGADSFILVWDWPAGKLRYKIDLGLNRDIGRLAVSADGKRAEVESIAERAIRLFDLKTGQELPEPADAHRGGVFGMAYTAEGLVVSGAQDDTIRVWDPRTGRQRHVYPTKHPVGPSALAVSADGHLVATADFNRGVVLLHERDTGRLVRTINSGESSVSALAFAPRGHTLAVAAHGAGRFVGLWDANTGHELRRFNHVTGGMAFSPDGLSLATLNGFVQFWNIRNGRPRTGMPAKDVQTTVFSPDGRMLATCDYRGVTLWELATARQRWRIKGRFKDVCFSPDRRWLAAASEDSVCVYDLWQTRLAHTFTGHDSSVIRLAFAPDGHTLASSSFDSSILIWDMATVTKQEASRHADCHRHCRGLGCAGGCGCRSRLPSHRSAHGESDPGREYV